MLKRHPVKKLLSDILSPYYYAHIRHPRQWGWLAVDQAQLIELLGQSNIAVREFAISLHDYRDYFDRAGYSTRYPKYYPWVIAEKSLEHFIAQQLLNLNPEDVYVDIASEGSPVPEIYHRLYGCVTYAQDLSYPPGVHGNKIGSDAAALPLPDGSVTKMALHCSFEHFEGDSDIGFIKEAARVLKVGGKLVITPLYLAPRYAIATDPVVSRGNGVLFEPDAIVMAVKGWRNRHGRYYDPAHLESRILANGADFAFDLMFLNNLQDIGESVYARFTLVGTRIDHVAV